MRVLVISDIHSNLAALQSVIKDAGNFEAAWCLGDICGYGPDPNECIEIARKLPGLACVSGNHDAALVGLTSMEVFNNEARESVEWQRRVVTTENRGYIAQLPLILKVEGITLAHGSPRDPLWEYILDYPSAAANARVIDTAVCLCGHTHIPAVLDLGKNKMMNEGTGLSAPVGRLFLNPGSVGQPRDNDPRASYAILDTLSGAWEFKRTAYNVSETQERMRSNGLPERNALRLEGGW